MSIPDNYYAQLLAVNNGLGYFDKNKLYNNYSKSMANAVTKGTYDVGTSERGGLFNMSKASNPFSKMNVTNTVGGILGAVSAPVSQALSGGHSSAVGSTMLTLSSAVSMIPGPIGMIGGPALNIVGGAINGLFGGPTINETAKKENDAGNTALMNTPGLVSTFDEINGPAAVSNALKIAKNSIFGGGAGAINAEEMAKRDEAESFANRLIKHSADFLNLERADLLNSSYYSKGGSLDKGAFNDPISILGTNSHKGLSRKTKKLSNKIHNVKNKYELQYEEGDAIEFNTDEEKYKFLNEHPEFELLEI